VLSVKFSDGTIEKLASAGGSSCRRSAGTGTSRGPRSCPGAPIGSDGETMARDIQKRIDDVRAEDVGRGD